MKNAHSILKLTLMLLFAFTMFNCTKDDDEPVIIDGTYGAFTDTRDNKTYKTIKIGEQEWMAENLSFQTTSGSWFIWNSKSEGDKYGRVYTFDAAIEAVPAGWHLPSDEEWKELELYLGLSEAEVENTGIRGSDQGNKLKSTSGWAENGNGTNAFGFGALPGGFRTSFGSSLANEYYGLWWTATAADSSTAWFRMIQSSNTGIIRNLAYKEEAYSVRCIKN